MLLKLFKTKLVSIFKPSVVLGCALNSIVSEMNSVVLAVVKYVFKSRRPEITFSTKEDLHVLIDDYPYPYIKLPVIYKIRTFDILLNDKTHVAGNLYR
jgi:hypothetical protein